MALRICKICGIPKELNEYPPGKRYAEGRIPRCRICKNKDGRERAKERRNRDPEKPLEATRRWRKKDPQKTRQQYKEYNKKRRSVPKGRLNSNISTAIRASLSGNKNGFHWESLVGYTLEDLKFRLEKQFAENMTWNNYGKKGWEIDHKIPIAAFNFETPTDTDFKKCWALKNLQPLWSAENIRKQDKVDRPHQPSLLI